MDGIFSACNRQSDAQEPSLRDPHMATNRTQRARRARKLAKPVLAEDELLNGAGPQGGPWFRCECFACGLHNPHDVAQ